MAKKLTRKLKDFAREYVTGEDPGNGTRAALSVYNVKNRANAGRIAITNLKKPSVQQEIARLTEVMADKGITEELLAEKISNGLSAKRVTEYKGELRETDIPDIKEIRKHVELSAKIRGDFAPERTENLSVSIAADLERMSSEDFKKLVKQLINEPTTSRDNQEAQA